MDSRWVLALPLLLAGCGVPPIVTAATWMTDGVVLAATGKSVTGHALSEITDRDCSVMRAVVRGGEVCRDYGVEVRTARAGRVPARAVAEARRGECVDWRMEAGERVCRVYAERVLVAGATDGEVKGGAPVAVAASALPAAVRVGPPSDAVFLPRVERVAKWEAPVRAGVIAADVPPPAPRAERRATAAEPGGWFLVLSSFIDRANADRLAREQSVVATGIAPAVVGGRTYWRVVVGPFAQAELAAARERAEATGFAGAWAISSCPHGPPAGDCVAL